jgi:betaine-aldehyde dehydrogenase
MSTSIEQSQRATEAWQKFAATPKQLAEAAALAKPGPLSVIGKQTIAGKTGEPIAVPDANFIDGNWVRTAESLPVMNPATAEVIFRAPRAGAKDVGLAVDAAQRCLERGDWSQLRGAARAVYLDAVAAKLTELTPSLAAVEVRNQGKPEADALGDLALAAKCFTFCAQLARLLDARQGEVVDFGDPAFLAKRFFSSVGVVAGISPWNYPLLMSVWKIAWAMAAGCPIVHKVSEITPCTTLMLGQIIEACGVPHGAVNILCGSGPETGPVLVGHEHVRRVLFTGGVDTGTKVYEMAAHSKPMKAVTLELGGKSAAIVRADADIAHSVPWVKFGIFNMAGQVCSATSRLILDDAIYAPFVAELTRQTKELGVGDGVDPATKVGPLVSAQHLEKVDRMVEAAKRAGAKVLLGGHKLPGPGYYYAPTILEVTPEMDIAKLEVFGPVLVVMRTRGDAEATRVAKSTGYDLAAAVFTEDEMAAERMLRDVTKGVGWWNCSQPTSERLPWGGSLASGIGRDLGEEGFFELLLPMTISWPRQKAPLGW